MAKKNVNVRARLLCVLDYILTNSDEDHPVSTEAIITHLAARGHSADRRTVYEDIHAIEAAGYDIISLKGSSFGYFISARTFEDAELRLLVDSIQSSRFITEKKTLSLIKKIESLTSVHRAADLQRQVYVSGRVKSMNETVYYNVDSLSDAINRSVMVTFRYFDYDITAEKVYRRGGAAYHVSPYALIWDNENYYLLAYDAEDSMMKHFRVDKMNRITATGEPREGAEEFTGIDLSRYSVMHFGMFHGDTVDVSMRFSTRLSGPVIDRFGKDVRMIPDGDDHFTVTLPIAVSPVFFSWIFSFGEDAEITGPPAVRSEAAAYLEKLVSVYK